MTLFNRKINSYNLPDVISYDVIDSTRVILHQWGVKCVFLYKRLGCLPFTPALENITLHSAPCVRRLSCFE